MTDASFFARIWFFSMRYMFAPLVGVAAVLVSVLPFLDISIPSKVEKVPEIQFKLPVWTCPTCTPEEQYVLKELQEHTNITDRNALATILGNIKQESKFHSNICEGGARVSYSDCHRGGYGLIQWTSENRYLGLGVFCKKFSCDPSSLEGQTRYMINEKQFQKVLPDFEGSGQTVQQYMTPAYYWLGWGVEGPRLTYAYNYTKKLVLA